jgi:hypothetical protein
MGVSGSALMVIPKGVVKMAFFAYNYPILSIAGIFGARATVPHADKVIDPMISWTLHGLWERVMPAAVNGGVSWGKEYATHLFNEGAQKARQFAENPAEHIHNLKNHAEGVANGSIPMDLPTAIGALALTYCTYKVVQCSLRALFSKREEKGEKIADILDSLKPGQIAQFTIDRNGQLKAVVSMTTYK